MLVIPRERPILQGLNSYYLDIERLLEHFQGEIGFGGVHFKSPAAEAMIFFDKDDILGGVFRDKDGESDGKSALPRLLEAARQQAFSVNVYEMDAARVYFWTSIPSGKEIYRDLSTEFTDLQGLIQKMVSERLTGYIDVSIGGGKEGGILFLCDGEIIGGSYSWTRSELTDSTESRERLIEQTKTSGGVFSVTRISAGRPSREAPPQEPPVASPNLVRRLEEFLVECEALSAGKKLKMPFQTLLRKIFIRRADEYPFLDPFAGEFEYSERKIAFRGAIGDETLENAVVACLTELSGELGVSPQFGRLLDSWRRRHGGPSGVRDAAAALPAAERRRESHD